MKFINLLSIMMLVSLLPINSNAQQTEQPLKVTKVVLENGFTVYLNEDHSEPKVYGRVAVKAGSKNDPADATGIAHYFEHIMFKGTDKIGTIDFEKEKIYLDSISLMYDILGQTTDLKEREVIQLKINDLTIKSAEYAIPNETDKILKKYGSTGLNAYTSFERTVYHNTFPPEQMERWLEIYYERFRNPVFRLFQSELETVYEERNMYADAMGSKFSEDFMSKIFQKHPYGQQLVIGKIEHLKNPSLSKMNKFYQDYYVANNMALILTGDFDTEKILPMIKEKFGKLRTGVVPAFEYEKYKELPFKGREFYSARLLPLRVGLVVYRTVPSNHHDEKALELMGQILSNNAKTGLLDKLKIDNEVLEINASGMTFNDEGAFAVFYAPKIVGGKSLSELEEVIMQKLDSLKNGNFDEELLSSIKLNMKKMHIQKLENASYRAYLLEDAFITGFEWQDVLDEASEYDKITKEMIMEVAKKYLGSNRMVYFNKMGLPKKSEKIEKPAYKPIPAKNSEGQSNYAKSLEEIPTTVPTPIFIDFNRDFVAKDIREKLHVISVKNPVNSIFSLNLRFGVGTNTDKLLGPAAQLLKELATNTKTNEQVNRELQKIGTSYYAYASDNSVTISLSGFDEHLEKSIQILSEVLLNAKADEKQLEKLVQNIKAEEKMSKKDQSSYDDALYNFVFYGEKSSYIDRLLLKDVKKLKSQQLIDALKQVFNYETTIYYVGNNELGLVADVINKNLPFAQTLKDKDKSIKHIMPYTENMVFVCKNPKAVQSAINIYVPGEKITPVQKLNANLFNEYFGRGMSSIVFQEIREFRSLAYGASAYYISHSNNYPDEKGYLFGYMTTQSDKTIEAITILDSLISFMPEKPDRLEIIRQANRESINTGKPNFRYLPYSVNYWLEEGFTEDPRKTNLEFIQSSNFEDVTSFYNGFVKDKPMVIMITGNTKNFNMKELEKFGKVKLIDVEDIRRY